MYSCTLPAFPISSQLGCMGLDTPSSQVCHPHTKQLLSTAKGSASSQRTSGCNRLRGWCWAPCRACSGKHDSCFQGDRRSSDHSAKTQQRGKKIFSTHSGVLPQGLFKSFLRRLSTDVFLERRGRTSRLCTSGKVCACLPVAQRAGRWLQRGKCGACVQLRAELD